MPWVHCDRHRQSTGQLEIRPLGSTHRASSRGRIGVLVEKQQRKYSIAESVVVPVFLLNEMFPARNAIVDHDEAEGLIASGEARRAGFLRVHTTRGSIGMPVVRMRKTKQITGSPINRPLRGFSATMSPKHPKSGGHPLSGFYHSLLDSLSSSNQKQRTRAHEFLEEIA
jgi:hypothetical protein